MSSPEVAYVDKYSSSMLYIYFPTSKQNVQFTKAGNQKGKYHHAGHL